jgi:hypothetical protein
MTMTEGRKLGFWHAIARRVEKEIRPPPTEVDFEEIIRRRRANAARIRRIADEIKKRTPKRS